MLKEYNHRWLHSLPEEQKEKVNKAITQFKCSVLQLQERGIEFIDIGQLNLDVDLSDCITIPLEDNTKEDIKKRQFSRAKEKREAQRIIDEYLGGEYYEDDEETR